MQGGVQQIVCGREFVDAVVVRGVYGKVLHMGIPVANDVVEENQLTCMMITHNMYQALDLGNRTLLMSAGNIVYDVKGEERKNLTVNDLLDKFRQGTGKELDNDRILLSE